MQILLIGKQEGFTLIEVIISVVLIGIITSLVVPTFAMFADSIKQNAVERKILILFKQARAEAISNRKITSVLITKDTLLYQSTSQEKIEFKESIKKINSVDKQAKICFFPNGRSSGGEVEIILVDGVKLNLKIDPITGKSKLGDN